MIQAQFLSTHFHTVEEILLNIKSGKTTSEIEADYFDFFNTVDPIDILFITQEHFVNTDEIDIPEIKELITLLKAKHATDLYDADQAAFLLPQHPIQVFLKENEVFKERLEQIKHDIDNDQVTIETKNNFMTFQTMSNHYHRKEKLFFPILEKHRHFTVTRIMWQGDDHLRNLYTTTKRRFERIPDIQSTVLQKAFNKLYQAYLDMIYQEETFLIPVVKKLFKVADWEAIKIESEAFGYAFDLKPEFTKDDLKEKDQYSYPNINYPFGGGYLNLEEVNLILNNLPVEITFIDRNNLFKYFNEKVEASEMMLIRTPSSIGRNVANCHPPKSLKKVMRLARDLKTGDRKSESMWFKMNGKFVHITYTGVFDDQGQYMGILETVQDIQPFLDLPRPEKRGLKPLDKPE